jgi:hypothetical protein
MKSFTGKVIEGTGMASGIRGCQDIGGTVHLQRPHFQKAGLDMSGLHNGTINIDLAPYEFDILSADLTVKNVKWHPEWSAETFSFVQCAVTYGGKPHKGYVYYPHPETKPTEFKGRGYIEVLTEKINGLEYGHEITLSYDPDKITLKKRG